MEKINFTNYPNMDKPINAENLNQMQTNIENGIDTSKLKSAILVILNEITEVTLTEAWEVLTIPFNKVLRKLGDGFSLSNDGTVVASNDVKRFRATVGVRITENYSADVYPRILSETGASGFSESAYQANSTQIKNETIGTCINNKNIYATITAAQAGTVKLRGENQYTYMLVEEL